MSVTQVFIETITKLTSLKVKGKTVPNPVRANNSAKTPSNVNDVFKYINIWDDQIDEMVKGDNYAFNTDSAIFVELQLGEAKMLLNKVTSYPEAKIVFHIFSILLDGSNDTMEQNIKIFNFRDTAKANLLGWSPTGCSSFMSVLDTFDYKHKNITKHLLGFNFCFVDTTGSIFDENSPNYRRFIKIEGLGLGINQFPSWKPNINYYENESIVFQDMDVYLCNEDNSDSDFNNFKWDIIYAWVSEKKYVINNMVYLLNHVYKCIIDNEDEVFNPENWELIA